MATKTEKRFGDLISPVLEGNKIPIRELVRLGYGEPRKWFGMTCTSKAATVEYVDGEGDRMKFAYITEYRSFVLVNVKKRTPEVVVHQLDMFDAAKEWGFNLEGPYL